MNHRIMVWVVVGAVLLLAGCEGSGLKTQKAAATEQWNRARATVLLSLANDQFQVGNLTQARKTLEESISLDPTSAFAHVLMARLAIEGGNLDHAEQSLAIALQLDPNEAEADYLQGVIHQRWMRPERALASYSAASEKRPHDLAYLMAQAEMLVSMGRIAEARALLNDRVIYFENSAAIRDAAGQLAEQQGDDVAAIEFYRQASVLDTEDHGIRQRLASVLFRTGQHREALAQFSRLLRDEEPDAWLLVRAAECELAIGRAFDARHRFDHATRINPALAPAWLGSAKASLELSDLHRAELAASKAIAIDPTAADAHLVLGTIRLRQQRYELALTDLSIAQKLNPRDALAASMVGLCHERLGRRDEALRAYGAALRIDAREPLALALLAQSGEQR